MDFSFPLLCGQQTSILPKEMSAADAIQTAAIYPLSLSFVFLTFIDSVFTENMESPVQPRTP